VSDLLERVRPAIEKHRDEVERSGRLPGDLVTELRAAGAFRLYTPRELGGSELPLSRVLDVLDELARVDGAVAWTVWNLNMGMLAALLPATGIAAAWNGGPDPLIAHNGRFGRAVIVPGGYRLTGTWKLVSGAHTAEWFAFGASVEEEDEALLCLVPRADVTVAETWDTVGLRGSDSNTVTVTDATVPADRVVGPYSIRNIDRPLYRLPMFMLVIPGAAAVLLGLAQAAISEVERLTLARNAVRQPHLHAAVGRADAQTAAARLLLRHAAAELDRAATAGEAITDARHGQLRGAMAHVTEVARTVLMAMYELTGTEPLYTASRIGRIIRDGLAAAQHVNLSPVHFELAGRIRLGLPAGTPPPLV
jgi:alkylation response protein AidB-like acyl-CoA dehydrogenase